MPEFTDSYEATAIWVLGKLALNTSVYHRYTTDVIERVSIFENNVNTTSPLNIGSNNTTGLEANLSYDLTKWLTVNSDFNYNYFSREGSLESQVFDFDGDQYTARMVAKIKLPASIDLELTGNYRSGFETVQGEVSATAFMDFGFRKKFMDGKGVVNLGVRDVFASRFEEQIVEQPTFALYNFRERRTFVTLGFSYGFGKGEAMTYSGRRR